MIVDENLKNLQVVIMPPPQVPLYPLRSIVIVIGSVTVDRTDITVDRTDITVDAT